MIGSRNRGFSIRARSPCDDIAFIGRARQWQFVDLIDLDDLVGVDVFKDALQSAWPVNRNLCGLRLARETEGQAGFRCRTRVGTEVLGEGGVGGRGVRLLVFEEVVQITPATVIEFKIRC